MGDGGAAGERVPGGKRRWVLRVVINRVVDAPEHWDEEMVRFHYEENHCLLNIISDEWDEMMADESRCNLCHRASAEIVGRYEDAHAGGTLCRERATPQEGDES